MYLLKIAVGDRVKPAVSPYRLIFHSTYTVSFLYGPFFEGPFIEGEIGAYSCGFTEEVGLVASTD